MSAQPQMNVTIAGMEKKSANPNAPYTMNTQEGVRFKVFDRDGIVVRLMGMVGQYVTVTFREEHGTYIAKQGPKAGQEVPSTDRIVLSIIPAGGAPAPAAVAAMPQAAPAAPVTSAALPSAPAMAPASRDLTIWRQTAMKIVGHVLTEGTLAERCSFADDLVHYFEHGRLPDKINDGQHKAIEALCGRLDTLEPSGAPWRDRVKAQARKQYGRELPSMLDLRVQEASTLIDMLQAKVNQHDVQAQPDPPPAVVDPVVSAVEGAFPGAEERPMFQSDDDIPFMPTTMDNFL